MRVTILAIGSRGDVQPLVALGVGLRRHGHTVRLAAGDEFQSLTSEAGLGFVPLGVAFEAAMEGQTDFFSFARGLADKVLEACAAPADAMVATILGVSACGIARERGIPFFYASPVPRLRTRETPDPLFPPLELGAGYNALTYSLSEGMFRRAYPAAGCLFAEPRPTYLFACSSLVVPRPADWGAFAHLTGYWFLDRPATWEPPSDVLEFLEAGPPPVCVGFGSMKGSDPERLARLVVDALTRAQRRGLLVTGWGGLKPGATPKEVLVADALPYDWLFPRVAAVVHHGGAGTTAAAMRAGVPSVVIPFGIDQPFWGRQIARLGVGPAPITLKRLTAGRLAEAIRVAASDDGMRIRAAELGAAICAENGVETATAIIERVAGAFR